MATTDYLLEIKDIKGESQDKECKEWIEIDSFTFGVDHVGNTGRGSGASTGKAKFTDVHCVKSTDAASTLLLKAACENKVLPEVKLEARKTGTDGKPFSYLIITLKNAMVASFDVRGQNADNSIPVESFSLNYEKITMNYVTQGRDGAPGGNTEMQWSRAENA